ncbi:MAG: hypothetical protein ACRCWQ_07540 [Bacilli bacterium]
MKDDNILSSSLFNQAQLSNSQRMKILDDLIADFHVYIHSENTLIIQRPGVAQSMLLFSPFDYSAALKGMMDTDGIIASMLFGGTLRTIICKLPKKEGFAFLELDEANIPDHADYQFRAGHNADEAQLLKMIKRSEFKFMRELVEEKVWW